MIWLIVVIGLLILGIGCYASHPKRQEGFACGILVGLLITMLIILLNLYFFSCQPRAIDVYRGRTTTIITYKDSVAIDTMVTWKDEFKNQFNKN